MNRNYETPTISTIDASGMTNGDLSIKGNWVFHETVALSYAYALLLVVVSQVDMTP